MNFLGRVRRLAAGRPNSSRPVDPAIAAEVEYRGLLGQLEAVRRSIADANAVRMRLEAQAQAVLRARDGDKERARSAVAGGDDDAARAALEAALAKEHDLAARGKVLEKLRLRDEELRHAAGKLEDRIHAHRARLDAARARQRASNR